MALEKRAILRIMPFGLMRALQKFRKIPLKKELIGGSMQVESPRIVGL